MKSLVRLIGLAFFIYGCGDSDGGNFIGACEDLASAVADASVRCENAEKEEAYQDFLNVSKIGGSCNNVVAIRDSDALYNECIPALSTVECNAFINGNYTSACFKQLIADR